MGWQDRDYARPPSRSVPGGGYRVPRVPGMSRWSVVTILIALNVGVHLLRPMAPTATLPVAVQVHDPMNPTQAIWVKEDVREDAPFALGAMHTERVLHGQVWRLFTSQYLHASPGITHLLFNMLGLYFFGPALERRWGAKKFFTIYTMGGLAGNILLMILGLIGWINPYRPAVGASGCILGLLGACAVLFPHAEVLIYFLFLKIRTAAMLLGGVYVYNIWQRGANFGGDACHIAGLVFGAWFAWRGETWWLTRGSRVFSRLGSQRTTAGPASPGHFQQRVQRRRADAELIDELLAKVYQGGLHSLSSTERKALTEATKRQQSEEERIGRTDRL